ncbi:PPE family protein, partial [Mycobacterium kansasii]
MNFSVLPPEINSAQIYAGPGSAPMLQAAASWQRLADELTSAAASFESVTEALVGDSWQGWAAAAMASAAAPYASWLNAAAAGAQSASVQAGTAATVFEDALAAIVHPAVVATNRNQLVMLAMSNLFGLNAPAIAATEAHYEQMWAQDVAALSGYHAGVSTVAAQLAPWQGVLQTLQGNASSSIAAVNLAAQAESLNALDVSVSFSGLQLVQLGTAQANSTFGGLAVALGQNSSASAAGLLDGAWALGSATGASSSGILNTALAVGDTSTAQAGGLFTLASAFGSGNTVSTGGYVNFAGLVGNGNQVGVVDGFGNRAWVFGDGNVAQVGGLLTAASTFGSDSSVSTGGYVNFAGLVGNGNQVGVVDGFGNRA